MDVRWLEASGWQDAGHRIWLAANRKDRNFGPVAEDSDEQLGCLLEEYRIPAYPPPQSAHPPTVPSMAVAWIRQRDTDQGFLLSAFDVAVPVDFVTTGGTMILSGE